MRRPAWAGRLFDELNGALATTVASRIEIAFTYGKGACPLYVIAGLVGLAAGVIVWYITSRWVVASIFWVEHRYPQMIGTRAIRVSEAIICGLQVLASLALGFLIARLMVG